MTSEARHKLPDNHKKMVMRQELQNLKDNLELQLEFQSVFAQIARSKYLALIESGFSKEEALILCK